MTIWRPTSSIRVKALGLHWRGGKLLAAEVRDDGGRVKGVRPPGGGIEFGEPAEAALRREFREELGVDVDVLGGPIVLENLYVHEGSPGHEILFIYEVRFPPGAFDGEERIAFSENDGTPCLARWYGLEQLDVDGGPALFPTGLKSRLVAAGR